LVTAGLGGLGESLVKKVIPTAAETGIAGLVGLETATKRLWAQQRRSTMIRPETSNKMIQKGLAFLREQSGTGTVPGAK
jgi:hypothetical protein